MVEHKSHSFASAGDSADAHAKGSDQVVEGLIQDVGQDRPLEMAPQAFDQIEARTVRRQPVDFDLVAMDGQPGEYRLGRVKASVVAHEDDLSTCVCFHQRHQEHEERGPALGRRERIGQLARLVVHAAVHDLLLVLAWGGNCRLPAHPRPHLGERRMEVDFHLVLVDQDSSAIFGQRPFFICLSFRRALS